MTQNFRCGDPEALITLLYDEGDSGERDAMAAHVARCPSCADEIASLRSTRTVLATWAPPEAALGFRVTREEERPAPVVLRPAAWWRQPLPAWAQAAAALLIFAAGMTFGRVGVDGNGPAAAPTQARTEAAAPAPTSESVSATTTPAAARALPGNPDAEPAISRADLVRLEQRLRALESGADAMRAQNVSNVSAGASGAGSSALLQQVQALLDASEERQRRENITMMGSVVRDFDAQRRVDLRQMENQLVRIHDTAGYAVQQQNALTTYLMQNVSQNVPAGGR